MKFIYRGTASIFKAVKITICCRDTDNYVISGPEGMIPGNVWPCNSLMLIVKNMT